MANRNTAPAPEALRDRVRRAIDVHGERLTEAWLHTSPGTVARVLAGLPVVPGVIARLERKLPELEREGGPRP